MPPLGVASREFCVPESTLRDRRGNITLDTKVGIGTLITESEEKLLVDHVIYGQYRLWV